ncbi:hypothetical protein NQ317_009608, partial [Molorchus minor]
FVICWSPYIIFDLLQVYGHIPKTQTNIAIATLIQSLAPLNSAANPVIYCLFSTHLCGNIQCCSLLKHLNFDPCRKNPTIHLGVQLYIRVPSRSRRLLLWIWLEELRWNSHHHTHTFVQKIWIFGLPQAYHQATAGPPQ